MKIQMQIYTLDHPEEELDAEYAWFIYDLIREDDILQWIFLGKRHYGEPFEGIPIISEEKAQGRNFNRGKFPYMEGDLE